MSRTIPYNIHTTAGFNNNKQGTHTHTHITTTFWRKWPISVRMRECRTRPPGVLDPFLHVNVRNGALKYATGLLGVALGRQSGFT